MNDKTSAVKQWITTHHRDDLRLIPPLAEEFSLYGGKDTVERARRWALQHCYLLAEGVPACAHGLYLMPSCPGLDTCRNHFGQLDHVRLWIPVPAASGDRPFLLCHPYAAEVSPDTRAYAHAHGLDLSVGELTLEPFAGDDWYGAGTLPIRMTIHENWPLWPIEAKALVLLGTEPVAWPDEEP